MRLSSPSFADGGKIPSRYTIDGENINPQLDISDLPKQAQCLCLIVDDLDAPTGTFAHWVVWNIWPTDSIDENSSPGEPGLNDFGKRRYRGPCPPSGTHRYSFRVYALDRLLSLGSNTKKQDLERAMQGHIIDSAGLIGIYR